MRSSAAAKSLRDAPSTVPSCLSPLYNLAILAGSCDSQNEGVVDKLREAMSRADDRIGDP